MEQTNTLRALAVANAEIAECLRDLCFALNMPDAEGRVQKIAGCVEGLNRAIRRIETMVLGQGMGRMDTLEAALEKAQAELEKATALLDGKSVEAKP
jgi:hypothetical protein